MDQPATNTRLLDVAIDHFGRLGLEGASTRAIARDADTLMSSITYHFGGKEGLYLAAAEHIAARMTDHLAPAIAQVQALTANGIDAAVARASLHAICNRLVEVMTGHETAPFARFIVREQADPTEAFARLYDGAMRQTLDRMAAMLRVIAGGRIDERAAKVRAMTLVGQILVFRVARATVMAATGWDTLGEVETAEIARAVTANLNAIFDQLAAGDQP